MTICADSLDSEPGERIIECKAKRNTKEPYVNDTIGTPQAVEFIPLEWVELSAWHAKLGNPPMVVFSRPIGWGK